MAKNRTIQLKADGTKITFGRNLTRAEKKAIKRKVTGQRLIKQAQLGNPAVVHDLSPEMHLIVTGKVRT